MFFFPFLCTEYSSGQFLLGFSYTPYSLFLSLYTNHGVLCLFVIPDTIAVNFGMTLQWIIIVDLIKPISKCGHESRVQYYRIDKVLLTNKYFDKLILFLLNPKLFHAIFS
jgi:hypothetical protein